MHTISVCFAPKWFIVVSTHTGFDGGPQVVMPKSFLVAGLLARLCFVVSVGVPSVHPHGSFGVSAHMFFF